MILIGKKMENKNKLKEKQTRTQELYRLIVSAIVLCIVMAVMLAIYVAIIPDALAKYESEGDMEHTAWLVKYASYLPPVIVVAILLTCFYSNASYVPVRTQKDKATVVAIVFIFTYAVLFVYALLVSPGWNLPTPEFEEEVKTLFEKSAGWFFAQLIPFMILLSYHTVRSSSEKKELCENEG